MRDLLGADPKARLNLKEHPDKGVFVEGLLEEVVWDLDSINAVMARSASSSLRASTRVRPVPHRLHRSALARACGLPPAPFFVCLFICT